MLGCCFSTTTTGVVNFSVNVQVDKRSQEVTLRHKQPTCAKGELRFQVTMSNKCSCDLSYIQNAMCQLGKVASVKAYTVYIVVGCCSGSKATRRSEKEDMPMAKVGACDIWDR